MSMSLRPEPIDIVILIRIILFMIRMQDSRLVRDAERELNHQEGLAWEADRPTPARIRQGMADLEVLKALLAA